MYKRVILKAFEKSEIEITGRVSTSSAAEHIADVLLDDFHFQITGRKLRDLYKAANELPNTKDISIKSEYIQKLCEYLGYADYTAFTKANIEPEKVTIQSLFKRYRVIILIVLLSLVVLTFFLWINRQRWMVWENDHYVEVSFDAEGIREGKFKVYNEDRIELFRKIEANCNTLYFNEEGDVQIWYGKNSKGELEYFTDLGLHPITGKSLKPITAYMIKKYACETFK